MRDDDPEVERRLRKRVAEVIPLLRDDLLRALSNRESAREFSTDLVNGLGGRGTITPEVRLNLALTYEALLVVSRAPAPLGRYATTVWLHFAESIYGPDAPHGK